MSQRHRHGKHYRVLDYYPAGRFKEREGPSTRFEDYRPPQRAQPAPEPTPQPDVTPDPVVSPGFFEDA